MLSHDLKNPITAIVGSIDIMREGRLGPVNPEQVEYLQSAIDSCNEVVAMIDNLLDVQRFEAGRMPVVMRPHKPGELAAAAVERFSKPAEHEGITITLDTEGDSAEVAVDRALMKRVFANLLVNAIKFTPPGGTIERLMPLCQEQLPPIASGFRSTLPLRPALSAGAVSCASA